MNHKQRATLHAVFSHPISGNLDPKQVFSVVEALGGEVTHGGHGHILVRLNHHTHGFHDVRHDLSRDQVADLRRFLTAAGVDPARDYPLEAANG